MARYCRASMLTLPRLAALATLTFAVVLLHWATLGRLRFAAPAVPAAAARGPVLQTRNVAPTVQPPVTERVVREPLRRSVPHPTPPPSAETAAPAAIEPVAPAATESAPNEVPVYPTTAPPPVRLAYSVARGLLTGEGVLHWQPDGEHYTARLEGRVAGIAVLDWTSRGGFDADGLAPERYVVRRGRNAQAANFQRAAGKITYSGPTVEHPLPRGAQDRLSWMLQLPAIVAATPERFAAPGTTVELFVSGARGDADAWTFRLVAREAVRLADGASIEALKFMREPRKPYDTRVEVWLDPTRHHLPLRARLSNEGRDDALELLLVPSP